MTVTFAYFVFVGPIRSSETPAVLIELRLHATYCLLCKHLFFFSAVLEASKKFHIIVISGHSIQCHVCNEFINGEKNFWSAITALGAFCHEKPRYAYHNFYYMGVCCVYCNFYVI